MSARMVVCRCARPVAAIWIVLLSGCATRPSADTPIDLKSTSLASPTTSPPGAAGAVLLPAGDYHLVTMRTRSADPDAAVLCSEPSPDWAIAFGTARSASASGGYGGATGALSGSLATTEAVTAMLGRTAGVVALRDGLYSACQAYANHIIGRDAYALILSQFGNLLVALASGSGAPSGSSGGSGTPPAASPASAKPDAAGGPAPSMLQVALMQQQAIQALLVACISENDPSLHPDGTAKNPLLNADHDGHCTQVFDKVVQALPELLKPPSEQFKPTTTAAPPASKTAAPPAKNRTNTHASIAAFGREARSAG